MRKIFLFGFFGLFLVSILLILLLLFNINFFLNSSKIKQFIFDFLRKHYQIELNYEKINVSLLKKRIDVNNLIFKNNRYHLFLPEGRAEISLKKTLKFNFYPEKIIAKKAELKIFKSKKPFNIKDLSKSISQLYPFELKTENISLKYESPAGWIDLYQFNFHFKVDKYQAFYEGEAKSDFFEKAQFKGRFNYRNLFSENTLEFHKIDLSQFKKIERYGIEKTLLNIKSEAIFEKDVLNIAFILSDSSVWLKRKEKLTGKYMEGIAVFKPEKIEISLDPIFFEYPRLNGALNIEKDKNGYRIKAEVQGVQLSNIKDFLYRLFPENEGIKKLFVIVKEGNFSKIKLRTEVKEIKDNFKLAHISISSLVNKGEIHLLTPPLEFKNVEGEIFFQGRKLKFVGKGILKKNIILEAKELALNFEKTVPYLTLDCDFTGESKELKEVVMDILKKQEFLKDYSFYGALSGKIKLNGEVSSLSGSIVLDLKNFSIKTPYYVYPISFKGGKLLYNFEKIFIEKANLLAGNSYINELDGNIDLKTKEIEILAKDSWISEEIIKELCKDNSKLEEILSKYFLGFEGIWISLLDYKGSLNLLKGEKTKILENLKQNLTVEGEVLNVSSEIPYKEEKIVLKTEKIPFKYERGNLLFGESFLQIEDSSFKLKGSLKEKEIVLEGSGEVEKDLKNKMSKLFSFLQRVSLKTPIKFEDFMFSYADGAISYSGNHRLGDLNISLNLENKKESFKSDFVFKGKTTNLRVSGNKDNSYLNFSSKGILDLKELSDVFEKIDYSLSGEVITDFDLSFPLNKKVNNIKSLEDIFDLYSENSYLKGFINLNEATYTYKEKSSLKISLKSEFKDKGIDISSIDMKWNGSEVTGDLKIEKKDKYIFVKGNISGDYADFKAMIKKKEDKKASSEDIFKKLEKFPFVAEIDFKIDNVMLPTSHKIDKIEGYLSLDSIERLLYIDIPKVYFCGMNIHLLYERDPQNQYTYLEIMPSKGELLDLFSCLYPEEMPKVILEGPFELSGYLYAEGDQKNFMLRSRGEINLKSYKGYLYRAPLIARVLAYISPIDLFRGKVPNLENRLLEYDELDFKSFVRDKDLKIDTAFLSAVGFRMFGEGDVNLENKKLYLTFYVSPFKTLDIVIEKVPYLGPLILGKPRMLVYFPLQVTGTYEKYNIIPLHPSSIGKGIFTFIFRFFGISEDVFQKPPELEEFKNKEWLFKDHKKENEKNRTSSP